MNRNYLRHTEKSPCSSDGVIVCDRLEAAANVVAGQEPDEWVTPAADFGQKSSLGLARPVWPLLLGLLHEGLVGENGLELE